MSDTLVRTVPVKLDVESNAPALVETARRFNAAATWIARVCWDEGITNTNTAHHLVYGQTRADYGLGAQLAVCARAKAMEALKAARIAQARENAAYEARVRQAVKKGVALNSVAPVIVIACPAWRPDAAVRYDARTYRLLPLDGVSLNTVQGRVTVTMLPGQRQRDMLLDTGWLIGGSDLVQKKGVWYLHLTQHRPALPSDEPTGYIGVDLGIAQIATTDDGRAYDGAQVKAVRERRFQHRQRLQKRNTRRSRARLRQVAKKEARFQQNTNHVISKQLVATAKDSCKALALEDLTGINQRVTVRHEQRRQRMSWAFYQLRTFLTYKALAAGVVVTLVDPRNTSRTCAECLHCEKANRRDQSHFRCLLCGHAANADVNAARNIARKAAVNLPIVLPLAGLRLAIASTSPRALAVGR